MRTALEAFARGTRSSNAHDLDGFAEVLADDVTFDAPGGIHGEGKDACVAFFGSWLDAFPKRGSTCTPCTSPTRSSSRKAPSRASTAASCTPRAATSQPPAAVAVDY